MHSESNFAAQTAVIVLCLNAQSFMQTLLQAIAGLKNKPAKVLFIDSSSTDATVGMALAAGHQVHTIKRAEFGHGRTRNFAAKLCGEFEYLVYLTQDASPQGEDWLNCLLKPFYDKQVAIVYGRQQPRSGASNQERFAREFNYPNCSNRTEIADLATTGIKAIFCSNSFAAYRRSALIEVGGFPEHLPMGEDMAVALRLLQRGHARYYQANAIAIHSHSYSVKEEFKRYFDIGTLMNLDPELNRARVSSSSEGLRFLQRELGQAGGFSQPLPSCKVLIRTCAKFAGFWLGQRHQVMPTVLRRRISMHSYFWSQ
jgi:rhamnosyltransferase